jgi:zinc protease
MKIFFSFLISLLSLGMSSAGFGKIDKLSNGSFLDSDVNPALARQTLVFVFPGGPALIEKSLQGTVDVVTDLLAEGPASMNADDYRRALFLNNAEIDAVPTMKGMLVRVKAPAESLQSAVELAVKTLGEPRLDQESFDRSKAKTLSKTIQDFEDMQSVVFFYGTRRATLDSPFVYDGTGSPTTVKNITLPTVKESFAKLFDKKHLYFVTSGPVSSTQVAWLVDKVVLNAKDTPQFVALPGQDVDVSDISKKTPRGMTVHIINKPAATDNQILFIYPELIKRASKEDVIASVTHNILGGGLTGRLGKTLRKERGLTYHASSFVGQPGWMIYTFGGDEQVEGLLKGSAEVVAAFKKEKLVSTEVAETKATLDNKHRQRFELPGDVLMEKIRLRLFGRDDEFIEKYQNLLEKVTPGDVKSFVVSKINTESGMLVLMGDAEKLKKSLAKAGFDVSKATVVEIDQVM